MTVPPLMRTPPTDVILSEAPQARSRRTCFFFNRYRIGCPILS